MAGALTAAIASIFSGSAVTADPYYEYTTLLLPGSGTNGAQNNTFLDGSTNNFTITRNGNTTQGTFSPFSQTGWGNYFDGTGDMLATPSITIGASAFCFECWLYPTVTQGNTTGIFVGNTTNSLQISYFGTVGLGIAQKGVAWQVNNSDSVIPIVNQWNHVAFVRSGTGANQTSVYLNGTRIANGTVSYSYAASTYEISTTQAGGTVFQGYISNARLTVGSSPYDATSSTLTVPTAPLTAITNTALLTCQSNRFRDASSNNFTITVNGDTRVVAFSPFNPTASWSAATYGGSGYFDGSGDYLSAASNTAFAFGTGEWTIECWVYASAIDVSSVFFSCGTNGTQLGTNASGNLAIAQTGVAFEVSSSTTLPLNQWNHVAAVRNSSNSSSIFLNGTRIANGTLTTNYSSSGTAYVNYNPNNVGSDFTGYMSGLRVVKGTAVYDPTQTTITVPTAPLTAITNTSLLLNCTNAGIYDATSKNDLETVDGAQISNTTAKWGSTSIKFDGTGDYLLIPSNELLAFGTGDFTIEMWIYWNNVTTGQTIFDFRPNATGTSASPYLDLQTNGTLTYYVSGSYRITTSAVTATTWTHVALSRSGTSTKIFINGTQSGSTYTDTTTYLQSGATIGFNRNNSGVAFQYMNGYIQDLRITKGYARYTANFTAPTAAFPTL